MNHPIDELEAEAAAAAWRTRAVGKRPRDFAARDLLLRAGFPSRFSKRFSTLLNEPLDSLSTVFREIPAGRFRQQALAIATLHYLHLARLDVVERHAETDELHRIRRLRRCPPYGVLGNWRIEADDRLLRPCDLTRVCPWCLARSTTAWMDRVQMRLQARTDIRCLLLSRVQLDDEMLDEVILDGGLRRRLRHLRQEVFPVMQQTAQSFGVMAGVTCLQAAPLRIGRHREHAAWRHAYHAAALGFVEGEGVGALEETLAGTPTAPIIEFGRYAARQTLTFGPPKTPAVRRLVIGWRERWPEPEEPVRRYGLVVRPTWTAAPAASWRHYLSESAGIPTFTTFGQFSLAERDTDDQEGHQQEPGKISEDTAGGNPINARRHLDALDRREALTSAARPIYLRLENELGAHPGRRLLLRELQAQGLDVRDGRSFREAVAALR
jgi:hypothetical protein